MQIAFKLTVIIIVAAVFAFFNLVLVNHRRFDDIIFIVSHSVFTDYKTLKQLFKYTFSVPL
jgi:hypothetical protein